VIRAAAFVLAVVATAAVAQGFSPAERYGAVEITPIVHSSIQLEYSGKVIQIDPWSIVDLARYKKADLILITDDPGHHLDLTAIAALRKSGAQVVIPEVAKAKYPDGIIMANGEKASEGGVTVEAIPAYDIIPGAPAHPKGKSNGYLITFGGARIYVAGVTECVAEVKAVTNVDVLFIPMNIPLGRMTPAAAADCVKTIAPKVVYPYHYDQLAAARLTNPNATAEGPAGGLTVAQSLQAFRDALKGTSIEVRAASWYPATIP
jgi:L-ascorbate metabolism protein UlaG (beta-lactamase superfamily)